MIGSTSVTEENKGAYSVRYGMQHLTQICTHMFYLHLSQPRKLSTSTAFPFSSHQHIIKWPPTPFYNYGTVRIHLTPPAWSSDLHPPFAKTKEPDWMKSTCPVVCNFNKIVPHGCRKWEARTCRQAHNYTSACSHNLLHSPFPPPLIFAVVERIQEYPRATAEPDVAHCEYTRAHLLACGPNRTQLGRVFACSHLNAACE